VIRRTLFYIEIHAKSRAGKKYDRKIKLTGQQVCLIDILIRDREFCARFNILRAKKQNTNDEVMADLFLNFCQSVSTHGERESLSVVSIAFIDVISRPTSDGSAQVAKWQLSLPLGARRIIR